MRRIDNQIDVFAKTFLGLTVALRPLPRPQVRPDPRRATTTPWPASSRARGTSRRSSIPPDRSTPIVDRLKALKADDPSIAARGRRPVCRRPEDSDRRRTRGPRQRRAADASGRGVRGVRRDSASTTGRRRATRSATGPTRQATSASSSATIRRLADPGPRRRSCTAGWSPTGFRGCSARRRSPSSTGSSTAWPRARAAGSTSWSTASRRSATRSTAA